MIVIIDTNILISALIRDSMTRRILTGSGLSFCYPEISMHEIRKHEDTILKKSGLGKEELDCLLGKLLEYIVLIPDEVIRKNFADAAKVMRLVDPKDAVFLAAAMSFSNSLIWSEDRHFEQQKIIPVAKTHQFAAFLMK